MKKNTNEVKTNSAVKDIKDQIRFCELAVRSLYKMYKFNLSVEYDVNQLIEKYTEQIKNLTESIKTIIEKETYERKVAKLKAQIDKLTNDFNKDEFDEE